MSSSELEQLKQNLQDQGIKYLIPSYVDMHGAPKTKMVLIAHLERMMGGSELFTGPPSTAFRRTCRTRKSPRIRIPTRA